MEHHPSALIQQTAGLILALFLSLTTTDCQTISGRVLDAGNGNAVADATIYIDGTTSGTTSDAAGSFVLPACEGPVVLVISHINYIHRALELQNARDTTCIVELEPRIVELEQVSVSGPTFRKQNLELFRKLFLGEDLWGRRAVILNEDALTFLVSYVPGKDDRKNREQEISSFEVFSTEPLLISMDKLGYTLRYDLINFRFATDTAGREVLNTLGFRYYFPEEGRSRYRERLVAKNRLQAYYNSPQHFTRSLFAGELKENGYRVYLIENAGTKESKASTFNPEKCSCISYSDNEAFIEGLKGEVLYVLYYGYYSSPLDLDGYRRDAPVIRSSHIYFLNDRCIIRKDGSRPGSSLYFSGSLSDKRIGATLPDDYLPKK